jgi:hypothetical protein
MGQRSDKGQKGQSLGSLKAQKLIERLADFYPDTAPGDFILPEWETIRGNGLAFLHEHAAKALELGRSIDDLIYLDPGEPERLRHTRGLAWLIGDRYSIISLDKDSAYIRDTSGTILRCYIGRGGSPKFKTRDV